MKDCNFRHMTTEEDRTEFIECVNESRCQEAKKYNAEYDKYIKYYLQKYENDNT